MHGPDPFLQRAHELVTAAWRLVPHPPGSDGFQAHYADLAWPPVTDVLQRRV